MKRLLFGTLWCVIFYFVICAIVGAVAGGIAGSNDPANAAAAGAQAGYIAVASSKPIIFLGAVFLAVIGSLSGILPGTRRKLAN